MLIAPHEMWGKRIENGKRTPTGFNIVFAGTAILNPIQGSVVPCIHFPPGKTRSYSDLPAAGTVKSRRDCSKK